MFNFSSMCKIGIIQYLTADSVYKCFQEFPKDRWKVLGSNSLTRTNSTQLIFGGGSSSLFPYIFTRNIFAKTLPDYIMYVLVEE